MKITISDRLKFLSSIILDINGFGMAYNIYRFEIDALNVVLKKAAVPMGDKPANS